MFFLRNLRHLRFRLAGDEQLPRKKGCAARRHAKRQRRQPRLLEFSKNAPVLRAPEPLWGILLAGKAEPARIFMTEGCFFTALW